MGIDGQMVAIIEVVRWKEFVGELSKMMQEWRDLKKHLTGLIKNE